MENLTLWYILGPALVVAIVLTFRSIGAFKIDGEKRPFKQTSHTDEAA